MVKGIQSEATVNILGEYRQEGCRTVPGADGSGQPEPAS